MKLTIIQDIIHWADKQSNLDKTQEQLETLAGKTDLVILPEMFSTGFCTNHPELAEDMEENTVKTLKKWALNYGLAIAGSFIATENGKLYNRGFFVFPNGEIATADKRHLFSMGGEDRFFSAGNDKLTVSYQGFNIRLLICYDVRFPVWSRNVNNEYDLLIYMANFPKSRISSWDILLPARAVENQAYVCAVNCIGTDGNGIQYNGHSAIFDYKGNKIAVAPDNETSIITTEISKESLVKFREKAAFWKDADNFIIN